MVVGSQALLAARPGEDRESEEASEEVSHGGGASSSDARFNVGSEVASGASVNNVPLPNKHGT